jgi:methyl-accepting chemotaxis protein
VNRLSSRLRIGEKIGLGFAVVCALLFGVVWYYHQTLRSVASDYTHLLAVFETRKSLALEIEIEMAAARDAEKAFLSKHQESFAREVDDHLQTLFGKLALLAAVDEHSRQTVDQLLPLLTGYRDSFHAVADAWRSMGLDENSGAQGAFRSKIHRLHELSARYSVDRLYAALLQLRRSEKDLALRRDPSYGEQVRRQLAEFARMIKDSGLPPGIQANLLSDLRLYAQSFERFARDVLAGGSANGGKGTFRDAAHRIEELVRLAS